MMRQAPIALRPSQRSTHPKNRRKASGNRCYKITSCVVLIIVIVALITMPTGYLMGISQIAYMNTPSVLRGGIVNLALIRYSEFFSPSHSLSNTTTLPAHKLLGLDKHDVSNVSIHSASDGKTSLYNADGTKKRRIAYAITISKDGSFQDGAAILAYSIYEASKNFNDVISFVAFVHPQVVTSRPALKRLGFHVIEGNMITNNEELDFFMKIHIVRAVQTNFSVNPYLYKKQCFDLIIGPYKCYECY